MKKYILTGFSLFLIFYCSAQVQVGVHAGISIFNATRAVPGISIPGFSFGSKPLTGFAGGIIADVPIRSWLSFRPELNYSRRGAKLTSDIISYTVEGKYPLNYITLPMNVVYQHKLGAGKIYGGIGPELGFGFSGKGKGFDGSTVHVYFDGGENNSTGDELHLKPIDFALDIALGYQLNTGLFLNGSYSLGFTDIDPHKDFTWKNHGFSIQLGYMVDLKKIR